MTLSLCTENAGAASDLFALLCESLVIFKILTYRYPAFTIYFYKREIT